MRPCGLRVSIGVLAALAGACIPDEPEWVVTDPRFRGVKVEVVEPGGYASLLNVPADQYRATMLPLDTAELTWHVTTPEGELPAPIWIACSHDCVDSGYNYLISQLDPGSLEDCPHPLPLWLARACRIGEGRQIRVSLAGAYSGASEPPFALPLLVIGSAHPDVAPASCLERVSRQPIPPVDSCLFARSYVSFGPRWAALPFSPESEAPGEISEQEVDTNPEITAFAVTRERGGTRIELVANLGEDVSVSRGERITVEPIFAAGSAQSYSVVIGGEEGKPNSGELRQQTEELRSRGWFSAPVDGIAPNDDGGPMGPTWDTHLQWTVPHDVVPTTVYVDVSDGRNGRDFAELRFVPDGSRP